MAAIHLPTQLVSSRRRRDKTPTLRHSGRRLTAPNKPVRSTAWPRPTRVRRQAKQCSHDMTSGWRLTRMARRVGQVPRRPPAGCACAPAARRVCKCPDEREALPQGVLPTSTTDSDGPPGGTSTPTAARRLDPAACRVCECPDRRGALPRRRAANLATSTDSDGPPGVQVPRRPLAGCASAPAARRVCECPD